MCRQESQSHVRMSSEEEIAAEESLSIYCKPVEFYNILQRRAIRNPAFLQRCLSYKREAKHKKRIQMTVSVSRNEREGVQTQKLFPLYVFLARLVPDVVAPEYNATYRFSRACMLSNSTGVDGSGQHQANFILPDINKLALEAKSGSLAILLVSFVGAQNPLRGINLSKGPMDMASSPANVGGYCLWSKIPLELLYISWESSPNFGLGQRAELMSTIDMQSCFLKLSCSNEDKCLMIAIPYNPETAIISQQVQVNISAEELGAREKSPYNTYIRNDIPSSSLAHIIRLRAGNVIFNYRYYNNTLQRTEVTEDFSCPFCLVKCASFKGLKYHLLSSHDLFNFEFWVTEECQAVNVSVKTDNWTSEIVADGVDPKLQVFFFCHTMSSSKPLRRRRPKSLNQNSKHVHPHVLHSSLPSGLCVLLDKADDAHSSKGDKARISGVSSSIPQSYADPGCVQSISGNNFAPSQMLLFAKTRKLSVERSDPRNCALLRKRQFFHSHRAQPMTLEQVLSDQDSEDEVDDDVADFEDRRMLDDFVDVTKDEKQMMHMWNSFVRKQQVLADGHIPWACEAFSRLHAHELVQSPALIWCWRLFMIKLWNHGLLDARSMNNCNIILEQYPSKVLDPKS
ncbi:polycomb group protein EMBRYONIC FLOWER 2 isoform X1 [Rosa chinensis]|uniref:polycomb group protein EMBRYONIC FLOWER 2 isoform X1 n=1 Tax=Rosa chinensis TaxID=74649 RepID=UPI000D08D953|nr:polycomb group protein EMBRYONIC FLOWER 2 isoform X1 [Rosa chinensis]